MMAPFGVNCHNVNYQKARKIYGWPDCVISAACSSHEKLLSRQQRAVGKVLWRKKQRCGAFYYPALSWIPPTSNIVERLFSKCYFVHSDDQKSMLPENFECTLLLKENESFWSEELIVGLLGMVLEEAEEEGNKEGTKVVSLFCPFPLFFDCNTIEN